ncbi:unnamed protein product [Sphenostylis stenocarpa]|uniref:Protein DETOXIFICATION n=1 Tax=Sphenostylis stenocarpa TaxID=92480 RepID=A0AA86S5A3_9FABA|nr:unnamed protein product [Sphenostylis stenocarpa]
MHKCQQKKKLFYSTDVGDHQLKLLIGVEAKDVAHGGCSEDSQWQRFWWLGGADRGGEDGCKIRATKIGAQWLDQVARCVNLGFRLGEFGGFVELMEARRRAMVVVGQAGGGVVVGGLGREGLSELGLHNLSGELRKKGLGLSWSKHHSRVVEMGEQLKEKLLHQPNNNYLEEEEEESLWKRVREESKKIWVVAGPAILSRVSTFGILVIGQSFVGYIGSTELAAFALVVTVLVRFANGVLVGMASALGTLCGQAYGARKYNMLGVYLQRSWIVLFIASILLLPIFIFTTPLLEALGQDKTIAQVAGNISLWAIGIIFSFAVTFTCQMFLQSQSKNKILVYLAAVSIPVYVFLSWLLSVQFNFGLNGALTSILLANWIPIIGQLVFIMTKCPDTWKGFSFLAFKDLWSVIKLSLSSGVMLCLEIWYNTVPILLTGNTENAEVSIDALSICLNISGWIMMVALGFFAAASVRVANELGRGSSKAAKFSSLITVLTSFGIGFVLFFVFLFLRERLAYVFTADSAVVKEVGDLSPLLSFSILLNSVQPVLCGVSVGAGWQSIVAYVNIGCYYVIGVPVGVLLGNLLHLEVKGIWIGMVFGTLLQTLILITITLKTDWEKQVELARNRVNKWTVVDNEESHERPSISS